jgi:ADP-heptose:LPS heptosyltransferase
MNVQKMMRIDRWLGVPLCFLATCADGLRFWRRKSEPVQSILFIKLAEQGSTVLAHRALQEAVQRVGRERVYLVVFEDNRFIADVLGLIPVENVITVQSDSFLSLIRTTLPAIAHLRSLKIGAAIDLEFFARSSALLTFISGAPIRVGFHAYFGEGPYRGNLMTHRVRYSPHLHTTQSFASLVSALDIPPEEFPRFDLKPAPPEEALPFFAATPDEIREVAAKLERFTGRALTPPLFLLNANASDLIPLRRWSGAAYVELAKRLLERFPEVHIAFTGAEDEAVKAQDLVAQVGSGRCFSLAGKTTLRQLLVLYGLADVLVTNDSGPAHFAALTPIHTVTLFGPETPTLFAALTPRNTALWAGLACSPCVSALNNRQSACTDNVCMQRITVEQVFDAVCASYAKRKTQPVPFPVPAGVMPEVSSRGEERSTPASRPSRQGEPVV